LAQAVQVEPPPAHQVAPAVFLHLELWRQLGPHPLSAVAAALAGQPMVTPEQQAPLELQKPLSDQPELFMAQIQ